MAVVARVATLLLGSDALNGDERAYVEAAGNLAAGDSFTRAGGAEIQVSPLLPALAAALASLGLSPAFASQVVSLLASAAAAPLVVWALWPRWRRVAWLAGSLIALHPRLLTTADRAQPETLAAMGLLLVAGAALRRDPTLAAVGTGWAFLARPEGLLLAPVCWLLVAPGERLRRSLTSLAVVVLLASPQLLHLRAATGEWALSGKLDWVRAQSVAQREGLTGGDVESVRRVSEETDGSLWRDWPAGLVRIARESARAAGPLLFLLAGMGVGATLRQGRSASFAWLPLLLLPVLAAGPVYARHVLPFLPLWLAASAVGAAGVASALGAVGREV